MQNKLWRCHLKRKQVELRMEAVLQVMCPRMVEEKIAAAGHARKRSLTSQAPADSETVVFDEKIIEGAKPHGKIATKKTNES